MRDKYLKLIFLIISIECGFLFSQEMPLVYDVENTCADCPEPYLPSYGELPTIQALPDPFTWSDGRSRISYLSDWQYRRSEIKAEIEHYEIGEKPLRPDSISASYSDGTITVDITVNGNTLTLTSDIILPQGDGPFPAVIGMGGPTGSMPSYIFSNRNIAQIPFNFGQVMAHTQTRGSEPINQLYPDLIYMGAYSAWSWGVSRLIDGLELVADDLPIDLNHLAVSGCSFAGKMALFAGALDERIALTIAQESGGGGYTTWRFSEMLGNVETLGRTSHAWFIEDMFQFSNSVTKLPHDHHELMAMVAPRALLVTGNPDYEWLADESGYVGSKAVQEVYKALGVPDRFGYSIVSGHNHCAVPGSQITEIESFLDKFLLGIDSVSTEVNRAPYNTDLSSWIKWTTPSLSGEVPFYGYTSLISPSNLEKNLDSIITFKWKKVEDAEKYYIQLSENPAFTNIALTDSTTDTLKIMDDLPGGIKYYWRVRVKNNKGSFGLWSNTWSFTTFIPLPGETSLISANPVPDRTDYVTLTWREAKNASQYLVQLSVSESFTRTVSSATTSDTVKNLGGTQEGQKYFWRVQTKNVSGSGPWSEISDFMIIAAPTDLEADGIDNKVNLSWKDESDVEDGYIIERRKSEDTIFAAIDTLQQDRTQYADSILVSGNYTYRVKAYKDSSYSQYSNEVSLLVTNLGSVNEVPKIYSLSQNYPNPFNPTTRINFSLKESANTKIILYDLLGREIRTLLDKNLEAGFHHINLTADNLESGAYFYRIQTGDFVSTKKMILVR